MWPPNHKLRDVNVVVVVFDASLDPGDFVLVSATSDEPDNGLGDGDTVDDIQGFDIGTADTTGQLRAERDGAGDGRTYTLVYAATDLAGNTAECAVTVEVPHSRGKRR